MKQLHAEGRAGAAFGKLGGRPKKPRASEKIAEAAEKHSTEILQVLKDAIDPNQPMSVRQKAVDQWLSIEKDERRLEIEEEQHSAEMDRDELIKLISSKLSRNPAMLAMVMAKLNPNGNGEASIDDNNTIDAEVIEDD